MTQWLSNKFRWLSLIATWSVVCIHSRTDRWMPNETDWVNSVQKIIAPMFDFAVPLFFIISGFMFVSSYRKYGWRGLLKQKVASLYLPAVIWVIAGMLLCLPIRLYSGSGIPNVWRFIGAPFLWVEGTEGQHFWYVRSLLIMFVLSPIVFTVASRWWLALPGVIIGALVACPIANSGYLNLRLNTTVVFFVIGAFISANAKPKELLCKRLGATGGGVIAIVGIMLSLTNCPCWGIFGKIAFLRGIYDVLDSRLRIPQMPSRLNVLFFVYCLHLIVVCWTGGVLKLAFGLSPQSRMVSYLALCCTFWLDILVANLIMKYVPTIYSVLAGKRECIKKVGAI